MKLAQYTYWNMVINNPDDNDKVLIESPNDKYIRTLVWTPEKGEEGTPHIQAWLRMQRNVGLPFMKKLYPRGHFRFIDKDEFLQNSIHYAQKEDGTTQGKHIITLNDPLPNADTMLYKVLHRTYEPYYERQVEDHGPLYMHRHCIRDLSKLPFLKLVEEEEAIMVTEVPNLEKLFCSPTYERMKLKYYREILSRIYSTNAENHRETPRTSTQDSGTQTDDQEQDCSSSVQSGSSIH